jgi:quinol monooxygenase YgiN
MTLFLKTPQIETDFLGCIEYKFQQQRDAPENFFVYEIWDEMKSLEKHVASQHLNKFSKLLEGNLDKELDIRIFKTI